MFQERFKSEVIDTDSYFLVALRYIHQNPVKAKIVSDIVDYCWSSYREYMGGAYIVDCDYVLEMISSRSDEAIKLFEKYSRENNADFSLEIEERKVNMSDEGLRKIIKDQFRIEVITIGNETRARQDEILK